jgi:hypothetical protein
MVQELDTDWATLVAQGAVLSAQSWRVLQQAYEVRLVARHVLAQAHERITRGRARHRPARRAD